MFSTVTSGGLAGIVGYPVQVEVDASQGLPGFQMGGYLSNEVKEAKERVRVALKNAGFRLPAMCFHVNLSPADVRKEGTAYDLAIAVAVLCSLSYIEKEQLAGVLIVGELGLNGEVKPVKGVLPIVRMAEKQGMQICIVPKGNAREGSVISGIKTVGVSSIIDAITYLTAEPALREQFIESEGAPKEDMPDTVKRTPIPDFAEINGQTMVKRAAEIAAAGFHNMLMVGAPGSGKTMIAKRIPGILPPLSMDESLEVTTIYSVAGMLKEGQALVTERPFVNPHHTITEQALVGGGIVPRPGAISRAHRGILFLDELTEFKRSTLDILRQPLEEKSVHIVRNYGQHVYPADFMLVAACNPCPCGYFPDRNRCRCTEPEIKRYLNRISGPLLDRFDICVETPRVDLKELTVASHNEPTEAIRNRVLAARERQAERFGTSGVRYNADMDAAMVKQFCMPDAEGGAFVEQIFDKMHLSARSYHRILKTARTIADLRGSGKVEKQDVAEAVCFRVNVGKYW